MKQKLKSLIGIGKEFGSGMGERNLSVYATSGCYYLFMSLVPVVMIICCILPYTPFNQNMIMNLIDQYFAESLGDVLRTIANAVYRSNAATLTISIVLTLYSASASMKAVMKGIDAAYKCKTKNNTIVFTIRALIYMALLVVALIASLVVMVYGGKILILLRKYLGRVGILGLLLSKGRYFLVFLVLFGIFLLFYTLMPADKVAVKNQLPGAVFSALIWVVFSWVFTIYVTVSDKFGAYGFLGTVMVCMMWMYYCLFFLLIGGFMNSFLTEKRKPAAAPVTPVTDAEPAAIEASEPEDDFFGEMDMSIEKPEFEAPTFEAPNVEEPVTETPAVETPAIETPTVTRSLDMKTETDAADEPESVTIETNTNTSEDSITEDLMPEDDTDIAAATGLMDTDAVADSEEEVSEEDAKKSKKKILIPIIALAAACAIAAIVTVFFVFRRKKEITVPEVDIPE